MASKPDPRGGGETDPGLDIGLSASADPLERLCSNAEALVKTAWLLARIIRDGEFGRDRLPLALPGHLAMRLSAVCHQQGEEWHLLRRSNPTGEIEFEGLFAASYVDLAVDLGKRVYGVLLQAEHGRLAHIEWLLNGTFQTLSGDAIVDVWPAVRDATGDLPLFDADRLASLIEGEYWRAKAAIAANAIPRLTGQPNPTSAFRVGDCRYQVGEGIPPIVLEESEDHVIRSLLLLGGAATKSQLQNQTGKTDGPRILKAIRRKHPTLAPHIIVPGARGKGGYRTTISDRH